LSRKKSSNTHPLLMSGQVLQNGDTFNLVGVTFENNLNWHKHIVSLATAALKKLGFLFRAKKYFSPSNLYTLYVSQIQPSLKYCSHVWGMAFPTTLSILDAIQRRAVRLINDPLLTQRLPSLAHRRAVGDLSLFYRYFYGFCSDELSSIVPPLAFPTEKLVVPRVCIPIQFNWTGPELPISFVLLSLEFLDCGTCCQRRSFLPPQIFKFLSPVLTNFLLPCLRHPRYVSI
jgi:hypothetical protein